MIEHYKKNYPEIYDKILESREKVKKIDSFYHATLLSNGRDILKSSLKVSKCGDIHGEMDLKPNEKTIYLSSHEYSGNLNSNLFEQDEDVIVLEIDAKIIDWDKAYPDDGMFCAFANEDYFFDEEDVSETLGISICEATSFFSELCEKKDDEIADFLKPLACVYLLSEGEFSYPIDISGHYIKSIKGYDKYIDFSENKIKESLYSHKLASAYAKKNNMEISKIIGFGNSGIAYETNKETVIKITSDVSEFFNAYDLKDSQNEHIVNIYDVQILKNGYFLILQEKVETLEAKETYEKLMDYSEEVLGYYIDDILEFDNIDISSFPDDLKALYLDIKEFQNEVILNSISSCDLTEGNIGKRKNGKYVVFDISAEDLSYSYTKKKLQQIKNNNDYSMEIN